MSPEFISHSDIYAAVAVPDRKQIEHRRKQRDWINPLRQLTVERAIDLCQAYTRGDYTDLMWAFAAPFVGIEATDPEYLAIIERRQAALGEMDWDIRVRADRATDPEAIAQQKALRDGYEQIDNLNEALLHLQMAVFRGFSVAEVLRHELRVVDHWNVRRDGSQGAWKWNPEARSGVSFEALPDDWLLKPERFIIREVPRPVGRIAILKFIRANLSEKDWDFFVSIYGVPSGVVTAPPDVRDEPEMQKFLAASEAISQGAPGVLPNGSVYTANDGPRGSQPFQPRLEWLARGLVLAGTGGLLTMLSQSGSGTLAGSAHMEAFKSLARADAAAISAVLQKQLDLRILRKAGLLRPGARALAWFELASKEEHDVGAAITNVSTLATHYDLDPGQVEEATGFKVRPKPATPAVGPNSGSAFPFTARASAVGPRSDVATSPDEPLPQEIEALAAALRGDLAPLGAELARALEATDGDWPSALTRLRDRLPEIAATIDPATIAAVEAPLARAIASVLPPDPEEAT